MSVALPTARIFRSLPRGFRWATEIETEFWDTTPDTIQVMRGGTDDEPWTDIAVPVRAGEMIVNNHKCCEICGSHDGLHYDKDCFK